MAKSKRVFICSPLRGNFKNNINKAKKYSRFAALNGCLPIAPHVYFTNFLDDSHNEERNRGLSLGKELLKDCEELWIFDTWISEGMKSEIELAQSLNIPILNKSEEFLEWAKSQSVE